MKYEDYRFIFIIGVVVIVLHLLLLVGCKPEETKPKPVAETPHETFAHAVETEKSSGDLPSNQLQSEIVKPPSANYFNTTNRRVGDIAIGQSVWIYPWTVWVVSDRDNLTNSYYINGYHEYFISPPNNDFIRVAKTSDGFVVYLEKSKATWSPMEISVQPGGFDTIPVKKFVK